MRFAFFVIDQRLGELIGAGCALAADNAAQLFDQYVDILSYRKFGNALQIAAASVDKFDARENVVIVYVEYDLAAARFLRSVRFHGCSLLLVAV